jgi:hypothetical protein
MTVCLFLLLWWDCWPTLDRAIDASAPCRGVGKLCWLEMGENTFLCLLDIRGSVKWPGLLWACTVRGNSPGKSVWGLVMVGHRPFATRVSLRRGMWVTCRWVKPESKIERFGDPPGPGDALRRRSSAVFTLGWWRLPCEGEACCASEICGTGGYLWCFAPWIGWPFGRPFPG